VKDNHVTGRTTEYVELDSVRAVSRGASECGQAIFRFERAGTAVADHQRSIRLRTLPHNKKRTTGGAKN